MDVLGLLRSKNRCLRNFLQASTAFLDEAERSGQLPDIVALETRRDAILKAIDLYDRKINEAVCLLGTGANHAPELVEAVKAALEEKTALIHRILQLDDRLLELIDAEKNKVLKDLSFAHKQAEVSKKFKSTWVPEPGEGIDEKL